MKTTVSPIRATVPVALPLVCFVSWKSREAVAVEVLASDMTGAMFEPVMLACMVQVVLLGVVLLGGVKFSKKATDEPEVVIDGGRVMTRLPPT
ncbi:hypothetical protein [Ottowia thiooxydans]|uniref:hypothetical protein n=1 Tax=Ottowia thiooxydans TaxID=219182 RepID=UPI003399B369